MYATVVTLGLLKAFGRNMALISLLLMVVTHFWLIPLYEVQSDLLYKATRLGAFFYAGVAFYLYRQRILWSWKLATLMVVANLIFVRSDQWEFVHVLTLPTSRSTSPSYASRARPGSARPATSPTACTSSPFRSSS